jgi:3-hydroxymyristoyl/3-hydroxydecanoyl-(acyl carrier protein) dehydratase
MSANAPTRLSLPLPAEHPAYAGHFPGRPVLPGVVLLDAALHALTARRGDAAPAGQIASAKFHSPVTPGEPLTLSLAGDPATDETVRFEIHSEDAGARRKVASGVFVFPAGGAA